MHKTLSLICGLAMLAASPAQAQLGQTPSSGTLDARTAMTRIQGWRQGSTPRGQDWDVASRGAALANNVRLHEAGKITIVDLWATWCTPCVRSAPAMMRLSGKQIPWAPPGSGQAKRNYPIKVRFLDLSDQRSALSQQVFPQDGASTHPLLGKVNGLPYLIILSPTGQVIAEGDAAKKALFGTGGIIEKLVGADALPGGHG